MHCLAHRQVQNALNNAASHAEEYLGNNSGTEEASFLDPLRTDTVAEACAMAVLSDQVSGVQDIDDIKSLSLQLRQTRTVAGRR